MGELPDEHYAALLQQENNRQLQMAYACGRLRSAVEEQLEWLNTLATKLSERGITSERRRAICTKQIKRLRAVLDDTCESPRPTAGGFSDRVVR